MTSMRSPSSFFCCMRSTADAHSSGLECALNVLVPPVAVACSQSVELEPWLNPKPAPSELRRIASSFQRA
eukprot:scaffold92085_cov52-Attheya_sp.AAC.1